MRNSKLKFEETVGCKDRNSLPTAYSLQSKACSLQPAFTLVEVLIVVAILAVVAAGLVGLSSYLQTQNNIVLTGKCVQLLSKAVAEFRDITGHYPIDAWPNDWNAQDSDSNYIYRGCRIRYATAPDDDPSSDELLYLQLSLLPQTREIIANLPERLLTDPLSEATVRLRLDATTWVETRYLRSIVDAWHTEDDRRPLNYERNTTNPDDVFPRIWSSGPDGESTSEAEKADDIYQ